MKTYDILIIGGGLIGLMTAHELCRRGRSVVVVERGELGRESSWAGGGILSPLYPWRYADAVTHLAIYGNARYRDYCAALAENSGIDPEYRRSGALYVTVDDHAAAVAWGAQHGLAVNHVDAGGCREIQAGCQTCADGIWMPDVAQVRNPRLIKALRADLERLGVAIVEHAAVSELSRTADRVTAVVTSAARYVADTIIVSAGAWSAGLLAPLGAIAVRPIHGQMLQLDGSGIGLQRIVLGNGRYLIPRRDGRVLVGSTLEDAGFDKYTSAGARRDLLSAAEQLLPALKGRELLAHWSGLRPGSPGSVPYIGRLPGYRNVYVNTGHYRNGIVMGLASAHLCSQVICEEKQMLADIEDYLPTARGGGGDAVASW